jgi:dipeptidyl aminopeptidase/acylaminoacyl peptidase
MKMRIITAAAVFLSLGILAFTLIITTQTENPGRLVFTDYATSNYTYTVDVFDLEQDVRSSLAHTPYEDVGSLYPIDEQYMYVSMCFARNNPMFCSAWVGDIIAPEEVDKFDVIKQVWQEDYGSPVWSPDGSRIAFVGTNPGSETNLALYRGDTLLMNADGTNLLDPTPDEADNGFYFSWSPDSQQIAFACNDEQNLCIVDADGTNLQQLDVTVDTKVRDIAWSPNGNQIAFSLSNQDFFNGEIYLVNTDGTDMHSLLESASNDHENPTWSPDGSKIAFRSGEQGNNIGEIYVIEPDGTDMLNLSESLNGTEFGAAWSPNSRQIAFFSYIHGEGSMYLYISDVDGKNLERITDNQTWDLTDVGSPEVFWIP